jgi:RNA 2',3'-cyclic 3'-phosphodiesterase
VADAERPWRCFVAVPIGRDVRAAVAACVRELRAGPGSETWRWTDAEAWHVTLAFLGATPPASLPRLAAALEDVAHAQVGFSLDAGGLGAFPSRGRARVMWYGLADPDGRLRRLAGAVRAALGLPQDDRFRGHLTLARSRGRTGTDARALAEMPCPASRLDVDRLVLYRSHLGRGPARYEDLATARLRVAS